jgi:hypothetical protein
MHGQQNVIDRNMLLSTYNNTLGIIDQHYALIITHLLLRLLHVSAFICHLQGAFCILLSCLKGRNDNVVV